jgi:ISXO2-like transposase domain
LIYSDLKRTHHHAKVNHAHKEWVAWRVPHQQLRELFQRVQARHEGRLPALLREHLHRYLAEFDFRHSNRATPDPKQEARRRSRRRQADEAGAQLELFPNLLYLKVK